MVTRATRCVSCWALLLIFQGAGTLASPSTSDCLRYVPENETLNCTCKGTCSDSVQPSFAWQSGTSTVSQDASLVKTNVRRQDNGTQFTCRMDCRGKISSAEYVMQISYGPTEEHLTINVNGSVIVGANDSLILTCLATEVDPTPFYTWFDGPCDKIQGNTCSFVPQPEHDGTSVICRAISRDKHNSAFALKASSLDLKYPPTEPPLINGYTDGCILTNGSVLTCRVSGGKPLVQAVNFSCNGHPDQPDSRDESSVNSSVTIDSSRITNKTSRCVCTATWPTKLELYLLSNTSTFQTEYKAVVKNFTINDTEPSLEVMGDHHVSVALTCDASGMPLPDVLLYNTSDGTLNNGSSNASYIVHMVTIQDMGTYKCLAGNVYGTSYSRVQLLVKSVPKGTETWNSKDNSTVLTEDGLKFTVLIYPDPYMFNYSFYGRNGNHSSQVIPVGMFNGTAVRESSHSPVVVCSIKPLKSITEEKLGLYDVVVANDLGNYQYFFEIKKTIPSPGGEHGVPGQQTPSSHGAGTGYKEPIIGGITAVLVIAIAVVAVFVIRRRLNPRYERPPPRREDEHLYTGLQVMPAAPEPQSVAHSTEPPQGAASVTNNNEDIEENVYNEIPDRVI